MEINNSNYEEYFLLYADKELSESERREVEDFVQQHPELKEEFEMILMTINVPEEELVLADKSFLKKNQESFIDEKNFEEVFVLYHDDELTAVEKKEVEEFLVKFPEYLSEFELFRKSKLVADDIVFADKHSLYHKEKERKVVPLYILKYMAAAGFVGFAIWFSINYFNQPARDQSIAMEKPVASVKLKDNNSSASNASTVPGEIVSKEADNEEKENQKIDAQLLNENSNNNSIARVLKNTEQPDNKNSNRVQKFIPIKNSVQKEMIVSKEPINDIPETLAVAGNTFQTQQAANNDETLAVNQVPDMKVQQASYAINEGASDENYVFYNVTTEEFNKTKVGGFLKKVKRIVERTNPIAQLLSGDGDQVAAK
jgi:hypothetical protein